MDNKSDFTIISRVSATNGRNIESKLRRLKIQESLLAQDLQKTEQKILLENSISSTSDLSSNDTNNSDVLLKVKDSYSYVKNLFGDINTLTHSRELLAEIDINEMKDKVLEFETKLKSLKTTINSELKALKTSEQELIKQLNEDTNEMDIIKRHRKVSSAKFNDIVPSPVKALMTSPLKCLEVQEYQDFMKNSGNRYGGWHEYNHNIFVKAWKKRISPLNNNTDMTDEDFLFTDEYEPFILELLPKLQGITANDIKSHMKWYAKYLYLKRKQQKAIEKWKFNRRTIKCVSNELQSLEDSDVLSRDNTTSKEGTKDTHREKLFKSRSFSLDQNLDISCDSNKKLKSTLMRPTAQWLYRTYDDAASQNPVVNYSVENIEKLCIPNWRLHLNN